MLEEKYKINTAKRNIVIYSFLFVLSVLFLLINSKSTSPLLFKAYGTDSPIFMSMGKMFYEGAIPYVDFFDHKGPVMIFIQALGAALSDDVRHGVFLLQAISLFLTIVIIYKTIKPLLSEINSFIVIVLFLALFSRVISAGNSTEEYCMFVSFLTLYYSVKFLKNGHVLSGGSYFIVGLSFAFSFWIRVNNSAVIVACLLFMFIVLIKNKSYNELKRMIAYVLSGVIAISLPVILYFIHIGTFIEMIDSAFIVNFDYLLKADDTANDMLIPVVGDAESILYYPFIILPFATLLLGTIFYYFHCKNKEVVILSICLAVVCYVATLTGHPFLHYSILNLPCFVLGLFLLLYVVENKYKTNKYQVALLGCSVLVLLGFSAITVRNTLSAPENAEEQALDQIVKIIPKEDYNSVFTYEVGAEFYLMTDVFPYCRYYILQEWQADKLNRRVILDEINHIMTKRPSKWVVINKNRDIKNTRLLDILSINYQLVLKKEKLELYKRKEI